MKSLITAVLLTAGFAGAVHAQVERPNFRIRADFQDESGNSFGNATVRVISRFLQVYYGGVQRHDEFRFQLSFDQPVYAGRNLEFKVDDFSVGTLAVGPTGILDVTYRSDWKPDDAPDMPLPANFPDPVDVGHSVSIYDAATQNLLLTSHFGEEFARGDVDQDGDVDSADLGVWRSHFGSSGVGPDNGDFSGDNRAGGEDYLAWMRNYSGAPNGGGGGGGGGGKGIAATPEPASLALSACCLVGWLACRRRTK